MLKLAAAAMLSVTATPLLAADHTILFDDAHIFDGEQMIGVRDVLVEDGRIVRVAESIEAPTDAERVDGRGKTLIPGLIDSHVHVFPTAAADALRFGVTSEFDMFNMPMPGAVVARRTHREGLAATDEADVWSAGIGVTLPGAHPTQLAKGFGVDIPTLANGADAAAFVKAQAEGGSDYIKIFQDESRDKDGKPRFPEFSRERLGEIIDAAHANGRKAIVHVSTQQDARDVFELGGDAIAHMFDDVPVSQEVVGIALDRQVRLIATLSVLAGVSGDPISERLFADPAVKPFLSPVQVGMTQAKFPRMRPEVIRNAMESVRAFHTAGVIVLAGTDAPNPTTIHGASMHQELELLVASGMTPAEALAAATSRPADFFEASDRGRIAAGKRADLVLVEGDPTQDILATRRIAGIWKNGHKVDRMKMPVMPPMPAPPPPPPAK